MIGLITQNNICRTALLDLLSDLDIHEYSPAQVYEALLILDGSVPETTIPIITLGITHPAEKLHLDIPIRPDDLVHRIQSFCLMNKQRVTFENSVFLFQKDQRLLILKSTDTVYTLTEKENDLLASLALAAPGALTKEELLKSVWNYRPDVETHTVESHIYLLRQKIGPNADSLIQSTQTGYALVTD
ncbi:MAG: winged helix-turn-helix domain-containing protein [Alphaproteobacteria bacterium]|nr:winged helix-turn-helix domain-containing protein [Alphaproteobacteria bacterium]